MSSFDGTPDRLTYAEALVELARVATWRHEQHQADVIEAIQREHGIYVVPAAQSRAEELGRLRKLAAEKAAADQDAAEEAELAELRATLGVTVPVPEDTGQPAA